MAQINWQGNPNDAKEGFEIVPAGEYVAVVTNSEVKEVKKNTGKYLKLEWEIVDGPMKKRKIFENLNLWNQNQQAVEIARKAMNAICVAIGKPEGVNDSSEIHNKPIIIKVTVKPDQNGEDSNNITKHSPYTGEVKQNEEIGVMKGGKMPWQK